jgi:hypothetical protein
MIRIVRKRSIWITAGPGCEDMLFLRLREDQPQSLWVQVLKIWWVFYRTKNPEFMDYNGMMRKPDA